MQKEIEQLNKSQKEAVEHIDGALLILAGAGTGKTKTITTRLAYLLSLGIPSENTLTLTFTNKASFEMRERALSMINSSLVPPKLFTFHKFGLFFLKFYIHYLDRNNQFVVIDGDDQKRIIRAFIPKNEKNSNLTPKEILNQISSLKNSVISPAQALKDANKIENKKISEIAIIYDRYERYLLENNLVDFDDLLMLTYKILNSNQKLAEDISKQYQYIMVDEYQDTNKLQLEILKLLCTTHSNICVVGDDDQSIYGWRGAEIENILTFHHQFENTKIVRLEDNYRSTKEILEAANSLISHNKNRHGKNLKSMQGSGKEIAVYQYYDEKEEAEAVVKSIKKLITSGVNPKEIAILFRLNALSLSLEEAFSRALIPFELVGTIRFYERAEIKDIISYMRLLINMDDNYSFNRAIAAPKKGIGKVTLNKAENAARLENRSIGRWIKEHSIEELSKFISKKASLTMKNFMENIDKLRISVNKDGYLFPEEFENLFGFKSSFNKHEDEQRVANIDVLYGRIKEFFEQNPDLKLDDFLAEATLSSETDQLLGEKIQMMSIHAAKGLEYEYLFVIGNEEGFFPMVGEDRDIEEERRLGYVAYTRAKKELNLSYVKSRFYHGKRELMSPSRFLKEAGLLKEKTKKSFDFFDDEDNEFNSGDLVKHKIFGMGKVIDAKAQGRDYKLSISFGGIKREILSSFIEKI